MTQTELSDYLSVYDASITKSKKYDPFSVFAGYMVRGELS